MDNTGPYNIKVYQVQKGLVPNAKKEKNGRKNTRVPIIRKHSYLGRRQNQAWVNQGQILILLTLNALQVALPCWTLEWIRSKLLILSHTYLSKPASSSAATVVWFSPMVSSKLCLSIVFAEPRLFSKILSVIRCSWSLISQGQADKEWLHIINVTI